MADLHAFAELKLEAEKPAPESDDRPAGLPVPAGGQEAMEGDRDGMQALMKDFLTSYLYWTHDDKLLLVQDDGDAVFEDDTGLMYFQQHAILNNFNARVEFPLPPDDEGLLLSTRMLREILARLGVAEHVLKVDGTSVRVWKTTVDRWPHPEGHRRLTQADTANASQFLNDDELVLSPDGKHFIDIRSGRWFDWTKELAAKHEGKWSDPLSQRWHRVRMDALSELDKDEYKVWVAACASGQSVAALELVLDDMLTDEAIFERVRQERAVDRAGTRQLRRERREKELREQRAIEHDTPLTIEQGKAGG